MNEPFERDHDGGNLPRQYPIQSKGGAEQENPGFFQRNGFSVFTFSPKTVVSWGMLTGIIGIGLSSVSFYQRLGTEIHTGIHNDRELNETLIGIKFKFEAVDAKMKDYDQKFSDLKDYFEDPKPKNKGKKK